MELINSNLNKIDLLNLSNKYQKHFDNPNNYAQIVLKQINDGYYRGLLRGTYNTVLDIGANVGFFSLYMASEVGRVFSVEPTPEFFNILKDVTEKIHNIKAFNTAVWIKNEDLNFNICSTNSTMNSIESQGETSQTVKTKGVTLKSLFSLLKTDWVDLIKLDIEGGERELILNDCFTPIKDQFGEMLIEAHNIDKGKNKSSLQDNVNLILAYFDDLGFKTDRFSEDGIRVFK